MLYVEKGLLDPTEASTWEGLNDGKWETQSSVNIVKVCRTVPMMCNNNNQNPCDFSSRQESAVYVDIDALYFK